MLESDVGAKGFGIAGSDTEGIMGDIPAVTLASGSSNASVMAIQPLPVPMSSILASN